jgi:hypothetical protein
MMSILSRFKSKEKKEIASLKERISGYESVLGRTRYYLEDIKGVKAPTMYTSWYNLYTVFSEWLDCVDRKLSEDAEREKIAKICREEMEKLNKPANGCVRDGD